MDNAMKVGYCQVGTLSPTIGLVREWTFAIITEIEGLTRKKAAYQKPKIHISMVKIPLTWD